jgi:hypothetical protein
LVSRSGGCGAIFNSGKSLISTPKDPCKFRDEMQLEKSFCVAQGSQRTPRLKLKKTLLRKAFANVAANRYEF